MPNPLQIELTDRERSQLEDMRDKESKAYLRERAAAILKIADGLSAREVARRGLLKPRKCDTVCDWVHRYQQVGLDGLDIRRGRGRKAAFFPQASDQPASAGSAADGRATSTGFVGASSKSLDAANHLGKL